MKWLARGTTEQLRNFEAANGLGAREAAGQSPGGWVSGSTPSGFGAGPAEASFCNWQASGNGAHRILEGSSNCSMPWVL